MGCGLPSSLTFGTNASISILASLNFSIGALGSHRYSPNRLACNATTTVVSTSVGIHNRLLSTSCHLLNVDGYRKHGLLGTKPMQRGHQRTSIAALVGGFFGFGKKKTGSVQSLGSVDSPRSFQSMYSQRFSEQNSYDIVILTSQEKECESEGVLEIPWQELSNETNIPVSLVHVDDFESLEDQDGQANSLFKESSLDFRCVEHIQVTNEVRTVSHATLRGLTELPSSFEQTQGASLISSIAVVTESESTRTVEENTLLESNVMDVPLIKTESSKEITEPMISTSREISRDDLGSYQAEDKSNGTKKNAKEEVALHPQNVGKKNAGLGKKKTVLSEIVQPGDPVLHECAAEVAVGDIGSESIQKIIDDMIAVMWNAPGCGLAAPQLGVPLEIIVLEDKKEYIRFTLKEETEAQDPSNSKGYGFCVYQDPAVTDIACAALNGLKMGDKTLTVCHATASGQPKLDWEDFLAQAQQHIALQKLALQVGSGVLGLFTTARGCDYYYYFFFN